MALNAKEVEYNNNNRVEQPALEAGTYPARLVQVIDLGIQEQQPFKGEPKPPAHMIMTTYEFVDEFIVDEEGEPVEDKPRWLSEDFVLHSLDSELAKSTKRYLALDPDAGKANGDWTKLIGEPVMVTIVANPGKGKNAGKVFNNIVSTSAMRKKEADKLPALKNEGKIFDIDDVSTIDILMTLPKWIQDKIKNSLEFEGSKMEKAVKNYKKNDEEGKKGKKEEVEDDEPPFDVEEDVNEEGEDW